MNKTILITLSKIIFHIEEDAYEILKKYLDSIKEHFSSSGDAEEILTDMESSIAEKFQKNYPDKDYVITKTNVEELIKVMGTINDIDKETENKFQPDEKTAGGSDKLKKLYRNPDDIIIAGVCSGLAAYFGIDPIIIRILFIITIFFGGAGIIAYLILWVVMPTAKSSAQKLEMQGAPVTLKKIEENIREKLKVDDQNESKIKKVLNAPIKILGVIVNFFKHFSRYFLIFLSSLIGITIIVAMIASVFGLTFAAVILLFNLDSSYLVSDFPIKELAQTVPHYLTVFSVYFIAIVPLIFLFFLGMTLTKRKNSFNGIVSGLLLIVWMAAVIVLGVISLNYYPQVEKQINEYSANWEKDATTKTYELQDFNQVIANGPYEINVTAGDQYQITALGREQDLAKLEIRVVDKQLIIDQKIFGGFCLVCFIRPPKIDLTMPELAALELNGATKAKVIGFNSEEFFLKTGGASFASLDLIGQKINLNLSGASKANLIGNAQQLFISASGASRIDALSFPVAEATIDLSGASYAGVSVKDNLNVKASGASRVEYLGEPKVENDLSGASQVNKKTEVNLP